MSVSPVSPGMVDLSSFVDFTNASTVLAWAAIVLAAVSLASFLRARRLVNLQKRELTVLSQSIEQLSRLAVLEYSGITQLGRSLASALNPTGEADMLSPEAKAAVHALGPEPGRILEEAEAVLSHAGKTLGWRYLPGFRER